VKLRNAILAALLAFTAALGGPASLVARAQFEQPAQVLADAFEAKADKRLRQIRRAADEVVSAPTRVARQRAADEIEKFAGVAGVRRGASGEVTVGLLVQLKGEDASELREAGFAVGAVVGDVATVQVEASRLEELAELGSVVKLAAAIMQHPLNDRARQSVGIDLAATHRQVMQTGAGVVVGVIDSGIDFRHRDFTKPGTNGTQTRIKYLLDMTAYNDSTSGWDYTLPGGNAPIGKFYTEAQINAALAAAKPADQAADIVRQRDKSGHGTHVAGTAAGNGLGAPSSPSIYAGMAPAAELIIVKAARQDTDTVSFREDDIVNGIDFIRTKAAELNEPFVINMSLGGQAGPHDGTSLEERAIDRIVTGGPGRVICVAAGNEGDANLHASTVVPEGQSVTLDFNVTKEPQFIDLYYGKSNRLRVTVTKPDGSTVGPLNFGGAKISDPALDLYNFLDDKNPPNTPNDPSDDQPDIFIDFKSGAPTGTWHVKLDDTDGGVANAPFDAWGDATNGAFTNFIDNNSHLVGSPGTARGAITVGAFITRTGNPSLTVGNYAPFTSPGPTADGRLKPDISAPGYYLYSTRSSDSPPPANAQDDIYTYGTGSNALAPGVDHAAYGGFAGTSMATPVTTGGVALLLQFNRNLTVDQVKSLIINNAAHDQFATAGWTPRFGNGKLNIAAAVAAAGGSLATNSIEGTTFFVTQHYRDFLNRTPDASGLGFWVNDIESCGGDAQCREVHRINTSAAFFLSIEFQETGFYAIRVNRAAFNRRSDSSQTRLTFSDLIAAQQGIGAGVVVGQPGYQQVLDANKNNYAAAVVATSDFAARFPQATADAFVDALYASAGVAPSTATERQAAVNAYNNPGSVGGANSRAAALRVVADSNTVRNAELNTAYVLMEYVGYLRRNPDDVGYNFWLQKLNAAGGDAVAAEMVKAFITSIEYRARFGTP
jgi:subtilisin family serine protease